MGQSTTPTQSRRRRSVYAFLALGLAATSACAVSNSEPAESDDTVRVVLPQEPPTLEPCDASLTSIGVVVRSNITEPLVERDPVSGDLKPLLASKWEQTSKTEWTFKLRDDVTFSDGSDFTAEDAAFSLERAVNGDLGCNVEGYVFGDVDLKVNVVDESTLTVATPKPDPILPLRVSFVEMLPDSTSKAEKDREPIGTGPYKIDSWEAGQELRLTANDEYWGDKPAFTNAKYVWRSEGTVRAAMVLNDEADIATGLGPEDGAGDNALFYPNNETTALRMQLYEPPLDDIRVRHAINYAIDRKAIVDSLFEGETNVAAQLVPDGVVGFNDDIDPWPTDVAKAKDLLAKAEADGVDLSAQIRLIARSTLFPKVAETAQVIQKSLADIGLNVKIEMVDTAKSVEMQERPFPKDSGPYLMMVQHGNQAGDAAFTLDQYMLSDGYQSSGGTAAFDRKIRAAEKLTGEKRQSALADVFAQEPTTIGQYAYLAHMNGIIAIGERVSYEPNSATGDEMRLAEMTPKD